MTLKSKICLVSNTSWSIYNFRSGLIDLLLDMDCQVIVYAPRDDSTLLLENRGVQFFDAKIDSHGKSIIKDLAYILRFYLFLNKHRPNLIINYTIKPVIYGSLLARILNVPVLNIVTGMGIVFIRNNILTTVVKILYKIAFKNINKVFFLNSDDHNYFVKNELVKKEVCTVLPGEGVNVSKFYPEALKSYEPTTINFVLIARILWEKGVGEYVEVARLAKKTMPNARFTLLGFVDTNNPRAITKNQIKSWNDEGAIEYLGSKMDVREVLRKSDCVVLPSYYSEGLPRSLLEASAMAIPIITTNSVGCRDVVEDGMTGIICEPKSVNSLKVAIEKFYGLTYEERVAMGVAGRNKVILQFDEKIVLKIYKATITELLGIYRNASCEV